jgi:hypothetical protein
MPAFYKIDKERNLVFTTGSGFVSKQEIITLQDQMSNDPDFDPYFSQVADFSEITNTDIAMADVQTFAQGDAFSIHSRRAIIVKGEIAFGFARIFELCRHLIGANGIRVFRDPNKALAWILTPDAASTSGARESAREPSLP